MLRLRQNIAGQVGVWSYRVKLYDSAEFPVLGFTVDCSAGVSGRDAVVVRAGTSLAGEGDSLPVTVYCEVWRGGPVVGAAVRAEVTGPAGHSEELLLEDGGTGYPDITARDGGSPTNMQCRVRNC